MSEYTHFAFAENAWDKYILIKLNVKNLRFEVGDLKIIIIICLSFNLKSQTSNYKFNLISINYLRFVTKIAITN